MIIIALPFKLSAQTELVEIKDPKAKIREQYYVLTSDKKIREGEYKKFDYYSAQLNQTGFYKNNQKDSIWRYYLSGDKQNVSLEGNYQNDKRVGIWNSYITSEVQVSYDYSAGKLLFYKPTLTDSTRRYRVYNGKDTIMTQLSRPPVFLDGSALFAKSIIRAINYPLEARTNLQQGKPFVTFTINANGTLSDYHVEIPSASQSLNQEALRVVKSVEGKWLPGLLDGKPVKMLYEVPVSFRLAL
jgi:TonB family protein